jgi:undecaprenyl-diphosphatase
MPEALRSARRVAALTLVLALVLVVPGAAAQGGDGSAQEREPVTENELTPAKALVLGVVEGLTEYLPVSSTGHLYVAEQLLDVGTTDETEEAAESYVIAIQAGAILAVLVLYWDRVRSMVLGLLGRDEAGRRLLLAVVTAFAPAVVAALLLEDVIKDVLFSVWGIVTAWAVGGVVVVFVARRLLDREAAEARLVDPTPDDEFDPAESDETDRGGLAFITTRQALIIGVAQCLAMWPGTSRSLVTIVAAVLVGLSLPAAVEFAFLLGLATLGAATVYETAGSGGEIVDQFGLATPLLGFVAAFVSAVVAVRWMVGYLQRHSFAIFGWYRIGIAAIVGSLAIAGTL